ncbi:MAG: OmpH family outer membrane protein [Acidobacteria bacterium]|nr:OmpH family outer membrane protein [Acidobacteriota bacterium]
MRGIGGVLNLTVLALYLPAVVAQQAAQPVRPAPPVRPTRIGVVDFVRAISETAEGKKEFAAVQDWANRQNDALRKDESDYNVLRNRYMQEQLTAAVEARAEMERQLQERETRLRRKQEDLNQELELRRQAMLKSLGSKMQQVVQEYGRQNNYLAILVAQEGMFAYVAQAGDLTADMVKLYDAKYPVTAAR